MAYYDLENLVKMNFKHLGNNVKISTRSSIYNHQEIEIHDNSRIDDFCLLSGKITIGKFVHIAPFCNLAGGEKGIIIEDFAGLAYGVQVFSQSDDYTGESMTNPLIPKKYKKERKSEIIIKKHCIIGTSSLIMPGVILREGTAVGAMSAIYKSTKEWSIYFGNPALKINDRKKNILDLEKEFLKELAHDTI
jgi:acetyltransferase-like isoleucine patch superfamily enzyme